MKLREIKPRHAENFIANRLAKGLAVATVNKDIRTLRRVFNLAIDPRGYLPEGQNPFDRIKQRKKARKVIRYVPISQYRSLENATDKLVWKVLMSVAYGSGLRKGEILNLTWADVDFDNQQIHVRAKESTEYTIRWEPKDHENRIVPMSNETAQLLADFQAEAGEGNPYRRGNY